MSYSDDLDWLARNVHEWPFGLQSYIYVITDSDGMKSWGGNVLVQVNKYRRFDKEEWLTRRAELQNKPSFADHPDAKCFAQESDGWWIKNTLTCDVKAGKVGWHMDYDSYQLNGWKLLDKGEVLDDWRDTLEQRPKEFQLFTSIEDNQEKVMKHDNRWHERGELPPVGTKCEYRLSTTSPWYPCEIKYVIHDDGVVMMREDGFEQFCSINSKLQPVSFRPIRSERDEAIEAMKAHCPYPGSWETTYRLLAESLYDAGYRAGCSE